MANNNPGSGKIKNSGNSAPQQIRRSDGILTKVWKKIAGQPKGGRNETTNLRGATASLATPEEIAETKQRIIHQDSTELIQKIAAVEPTVANATSKRFGFPATVTLNPDTYELTEDSDMVMGLNYTHSVAGTATIGEGTNTVTLDVRYDEYTGLQRPIISHYIPGSRYHIDTPEDLKKIMLPME